MERNLLKLYLVTDSGICGAANLENVVAEAVAGGVTMVQLREKTMCTRDFVKTACRLSALLRPRHIPLIINDRVDVALACNADGVHLGQSDMPYETARLLLGPHRIIGLSVECPDDVVKANSMDVDYIGASPVFATPTKSDTAEPLGLDGLKRVVELSVHPVVAIGGMNAATVPGVMECGADGVAVVSAIMGASSPRESAAAISKLVENGTIQIL